MALLLAFVLVAIKIVATSVLAVELASPAFNDRVGTVALVRIEAFLLIASIFAKYLLLNLPAIASRRNSHFTSTAETFMT